MTISPISALPQTAAVDPADESVRRRIEEAKAHVWEHRHDSSFGPHLQEKARYQESIDTFIAVQDLLQPTIDKIQGKDIMLLLGNTKAGKSTTMLFLSGRDFEKTTDGLRLLTAGTQGPAAAAEQPLFTESGDDLIGHDPCVSCTTIPNCQPLKPTADSEILMVDFPGFYDSRGWQFRVGFDITIRNMLKAARSVKIMTIVNADSVCTAAGWYSRQCLEKVKSVFGSDASEHCLIGITNIHSGLRPNVVMNLTRQHSREFGGFQNVVQVDPSIADTRKDLLERISRLTPLPGSAVRQIKFESEDIWKFSELMESEDTINRFIQLALAAPAGETYSNTQEEFNAKVRRFNEILNAATEKSICGRLDPLLDRIMSWDDPSLTQKVLKADKEILNTILKRLANDFYAWYDRLSESEKENPTILAIISKVHREDIAPEGLIAQPADLASQAFLDYVETIADSCDKLRNKTDLKLDQLLPKQQSTTTKYGDSFTEMLKLIQSSSVIGQQRSIQPTSASSPSTSASRNWVKVAFNCAGKALAAIFSAAKWLGLFFVNLFRRKQPAP